MIKKILKNQFFKVLSYNSIIILGKVITSFVVSKVSAIYLGPSGFALVGNFKNLFQGVLGITSSGFESGVTAKLMGTVTAVVFGGTMTLITVITTALVSPTFRKLDLRKDFDDNRDD
mgnify:CR=1 FL=1